MDWMTLSGYRLPPGTHAGAVAAAVAANAANASAAAAAAAASTAAGATKPELNRSNSAMSDHGNGGGGGGGGGPQPPPETPSPELWSGGGGIGSAGMNQSCLSKTAHSEVSLDATRGHAAKQSQIRPSNQLFLPFSLWGQHPGYAHCTF